MSADVARPSSRPDARRGLTLLELVVAVGLLALFAGALLPGFARARKVRRGDEVVERTDRIEAAIRAYTEDVLALPASLGALSVSPGGGVRWGGPYLGDDFAQAPPGTIARYDDDAFGRPFEYATLSPFRAQLRSLGSDGIRGNADDFVRTISIVPELRAETLDRLKVLNALSQKYNQVVGGPSTSSFSAFRTALVGALYLNDDPRYAQDAFGNTFLVSATDPPALRITSPALRYSTDDPVAPVPAAPRCP